MWASYFSYHINTLSKERATDIKSRLGGRASQERMKNEQKTVTKEMFDSHFYEYNIPQIFGFVKNIKGYTF